MSSNTSVPLRIGFLSPHNPFDRRSFSGTAYFAAHALRKNPAIQLKILGTHRPPGLRNWLLRRTTPKLDELDPREFDGLDAVISLVASQLIDRFADKCDVPFIHVTDATPAFLRECYGWNIPPEADAREARVVQKASAVVYSSNEMAERAKSEFGIAAARSVPFGINLGARQRPAKCPGKPPLDRINLLFVGNDWVRKGGDTAFATLQELRRQGVDAHLTIVGNAPFFLKKVPDVTVVGYLNKNKPDQSAKLAQLYSEAHFLVLPTTADCSPMVIAEAMAFGTPVLASDTGGVATLVGGAGTGRTLPVSATAEDWAQAIMSLVADPFAYEAMSDACFDRANTRLTWRAWCDDMLRVIETLDRKGVTRDRTVAAA